MAGAAVAAELGAGVPVGLGLPVGGGVAVGLGLTGGAVLWAGLGWAVGRERCWWCRWPGVPAALAGGLAVAGAGASVPTRVTWLPRRTRPVGCTASTLPGGSRLLGRHRTWTVRPR